MKKEKPTIDKVIQGFTKEEAKNFHEMLKLVVDNADNGHEIKVITLMSYMDWENN